MRSTPREGLQHDDPPAPGSVDISVVVPVHDEVDNVALLYEQVRAACEPAGRFELLFADDGSTDGTAAAVRRLAAADARVRLIRLRRNYGQTAAMAAGFEHARGEVIVSMDGDLQNDPADIARLLAKLEDGYEIVTGWRRERQDPFWTRRLPSLIANRLIRALTGVRVHDLGCSLKAYRAPVIKNLALYGQLHRFIPPMASLLGARVAEIPVTHRARRFGRSKYGMWRVWGVLLDSVTVKMLTSFSSRPAAWFACLALPSALLAGLAVLGAIATYRAPSDSSPLVIMSVALLFSLLAVHQLAIGILGELLVRTGHRRSARGAGRDRPGR